MTARLLRIAALALVLSVAAPGGASADRFVDPGGPTFLSTGSELVAFDGFVYFAADNGVVGKELWRTDGTAAGTTLVKDFYTGSASNDGNPSGFLVVGNRLYLNVANDGVDSNHVVYYIEPGGMPQKTQVTGGGVANGPLLGAVNGKVLLRYLENGNSNYGLYALGAPGSTFTKISSGFNNVGTEPAAILNGKAYFISATGANSANEPWVTDGTAVNTSMLKDIVVGPNGSQPIDLIATSDRVYFTADDGTHGRELWATDGSEGNTAIVHEHRPLSTSTPFGAARVANGNTLYYLPNDPATGQEVWRTQGTTATTSVVNDLNPGPASSGSPTMFAFKNAFGMLLGSQSYASDGTAAGTTALGGVDNDGYGPGHPLAVGDRFYYRGGFSPIAGVVWRTDGTPAGTFALTAGPYTGATNGALMAGPFVALGAKVIFTALYPHPPGDGIPGSARRVYVIDTAQPDETRQATTAPSISGTPVVGQKLTGNPGAWTLEPNKFVYAWLRNGTPIPGATSTGYTLQAADAGTQITFRVTASGIGPPNSVTGETPAVAVVGATTGPPTTPPTTPPSSAKLTLTLRTKAKLTGTPRVGKRLKLRAPTFAQTGVKLAIRWYANSKLIKKQTKVTLKLGRALKGKRISVKVTATKSGYTTRTLTAGPTRKVRPR